MFNYKKYIIFLSLILLLANFLSACGVKKELYRVEDENR
jgi:predicted small lipoprotein YifL